MSTADIDTEIYDRVLSVIAKNRGLKKKDIQPQARLFHDLGCDGMDADDLLASLRDEFAIDFSDFVFTRHFGPEVGFNPIAWLYWLLFERDKLNARGTAWKKIPITVMDLYEAAKTKKFPELSNRAAE